MAQPKPEIPDTWALAPGLMSLPGADSILKGRYHSHNRRHSQGLLSLQRQMSFPGADVTQETEVTPRAEVTPELTSLSDLPLLPAESSEDSRVL